MVCSGLVGLFAFPPRCLNQVCCLWNVTLLFLESQDSGYLYFCFRWLLIRFKREFSFQDILRLWEVRRCFITQSPAVFGLQNKKHGSFCKAVNTLIDFFLNWFHTMSWGQTSVRYMFLAKTATWELNEKYS